MRHLPSIFKLKSIFAGGILFALASFSEAAPICSQVLVVYSEQSIQSTLTEVAELKVSLDLSLSGGASKNNPAIKAISKEYPLKYQELVRKLSGKYSEKEIRQLIAQEIVGLQGRKEEEQAQERTARKTQRQDLALSHEYVLNSSVENGNPPGTPWKNNKIFYFLEKSNSEVFKIGGKVYRFLRKKYTAQLVSPSYAKVKVSKDEKYIFVLNDQGVSIFDTIKGEIIKVFAEPKIESKDLEDAEIDVDPSNSHLLVSINGSSLHIIDLGNDNVQTFTNQNSKISGWHRESQFLDSENIVFRGDNRIQIFNWKQNTLRSGYEIPADSPAKLYVSADKQRLFLTEEFSRQTHVRTFEVNDIHRPIRMNSDAPVTNGVFQLISMPDNNLVLIEGAGTASSFDIYSVTDFSKPLFTFKSERKEGLEESRGIAVSADGKIVVNAVETSKKHYLDIWHRIDKE